MRASRFKLQTGAVQRLGERRRAAALGPTHRVGPGTATRARVRTQSLDGVEPLARGVPRERDGDLVGAARLRAFRRGVKHDAGLRLRAFVRRAEERQQQLGELRVERVSRHRVGDVHEKHHVAVVRVGAIAGGEIFRVRLGLER